MGKFLQGVIVGCVAAVVALAMHFAGALKWVEDGTWDLRARRLAAPVSSSSSVCIIFIDQTSLDWMHEENTYGWPWPRAAYEPILAFCKRARVKSFGFDILFTEPSVWGVEDDVALGRAIAQTPGVVAGGIFTRAQGTTTKWPVELDLRDFPVRGLNEVVSGRTGAKLRCERARFPVRYVATNVFAVADVRISMDTEGVLRRVPLFASFDGHFVPSFGLAMFLAGEGVQPVKLRPGSLQVGAREIPLDRDGMAILKFRGKSQTHRAFNARDIIRSELNLREGKKPDIDPGALRNCYVLIGVSAPGLKDLRPVPVDPNYPGVEVQATVLDNILAADFVRELPEPVVWLIVAVLALAAGVACRHAENVWQTAAVSAGALALAWIPSVGAYLAGYWWPVAAPTAGVAVALAGAITLNYVVEGRQKRFIKQAFRQYLSSEVIEELVRQPGRLQLGGQARELTLFFSDIKGFTTISEQLEPAKLTAMLNEYLTAMTDTIMDHGGTVDKYVGDAIVAFWNAPMPASDHAERAVRAALTCQKKLEDMRPELKSRYGVDVHCRIGVNTGTVVVGNMGSKRRFDYTFIGDAGNLASRLEGVNKYFGTHVMVSEFTCRHIAGRFPVREVSRISVVGRKEPVRVFEPILPEEYESRKQTLAVFNLGLTAYYDGHFGAAVELFEKIADQDATARIYLERCRSLVTQPPATWNGVWEMKEK